VVVGAGADSVGCGVDSVGCGVDSVGCGSDDELVSQGQVPVSRVRVDPGLRVIGSLVSGSVEANWHWS
jgi:hypothetical protein